MLKFLAALLLFCELGNSRPLTVLIDPGHGGRDHGAANLGVNESTITLAVSRQLAQILSQDRRFEVRLTRDSDVGVSLFRRARLAKDNHADLFLSIHVNTSSDPKAKGAEFYFQNQLPPDQESMYLAHQENVAEAGEVVLPLTYDFLDKNSYAPEVSSILNDMLDGDRILRSSQLSKSLRLSWRTTHNRKITTIRQAPFYVLSQLRAPSALVELGFLSNSEDYEQLNSSVAQKKMAQDLYHGLLAYKESIDKAPQSP